MCHLLLVQIASSSGYHLSGTKRQVDKASHNPVVGKEADRLFDRSILPRRHRPCVTERAYEGGALALVEAAEERQVVAASQCDQERSNAMRKPTCPADVSGVFDVRAAAR